MSKRKLKVLAKRTAETLKFLPVSIRRGIESLIDNAYYKSGIDYPYRSYEAMNYLLKNFDFNTVLDIGCGEGIHSDIFLKAGKNVTAIDYGRSYYFNKMKSEPSFKCIVDDFMTHDFQEKFDCVWCSHVLEHQLNPHDFLKKVTGLLKTHRGGGGNISDNCSAVRSDNSRRPCKFLECRPASL